MASNSTDKSTFLGVLLIVFGGLFLIKNFDLVPWQIEYYLFNWKGILVVLGVITLATKEDKMPGIILTVIGSIFILTKVFSDLLDLSIGIRELFWPIIFFVAGFAVLSRRKISLPDFGGSTESADILNDVNIFGGGDKKINTDEFTGGKATAIFGGASYDFTGSSLAVGKNTLDVFAMFGGFTFLVPSDWDVHLEVTCLFGGLSDKRKYHSAATSNSTKHLYLKGFILFGGGEIKNA